MSRYYTASFRIITLLGISEEFAMILIFQRRAEIALRSLQAIEQKQIKRSLEELLHAQRSELHNNHKLHSLRLGSKEKQLFIYKGTPKLRLVISFPDSETCLVQDIVAHDRLQYLLKKEGQE